MMMALILSGTRRPAAMTMRLPTRMAQLFAKVPIMPCCSPIDLGTASYSVMTPIAIFFILIRRLKIIVKSGPLTNSNLKLGKVVPEAAKNALLAGAAGAIIGAAVGIAGGGVGEAIGKGAAVGTAAGAVMGGTRGLSDYDVQMQTREDLEMRFIKRKAIPPLQVAHGFIFFPGEARNAREIRLFLRAIDTGQTYPLNLKF